jgi:hypothetical protein
MGGQSRAEFGAHYVCGICMVLLRDSTYCPTRNNGTKSGAKDMTTATSPVAAYEVRHRRSSGPQGLGPGPPVLPKVERRKR